MNIKFLTLLAVASLFAVACNDKKDPDDPEKEKNEKTYKEPLTQAEQKEKLSAIGLELLEYADVSKWGDAVVSFAKFATVFDGDYDKSAFGHLQDAGIFGTITLDSPYYNNYGWWCDYREPGTQDNTNETTIQLSKINGKHTLNDAKKAWEYSPASDFSIEATVDGSKFTCQAKIEDYNDRVLVNSSYHESGYTWKDYTTGPAMYTEWVTDDYGNKYMNYVSRNNNGQTEYHFYNPVTKEDLGWFSDSAIYNDYEAFRNKVSVPAGKQVIINRNNAYAYIPKKVAASLSEGSGKVADASINISYKGAEAGVLDISSDQLGLDFNFTASGYTLKSEKVNYLSESADVAYVFSYGDKKIITMSVTEKGASIVKSDKDRRYEGSSDPISYYEIVKGTNYEVSNMPSSITVEADVLGELQISGDADVEKLMEISQKLSESRESEATFKSWVGQAEQCLKINVFYDNSTERSAYLGLEPVKEDNTWKVVPVIRFADGTSYAVFEVFFNENDFADLILAIQAWEKKVDEFVENQLNIGKDND